MDDRLYQVRVTALATDRIPPARIHAAFAELFCLTVPEAEARLAALPLTVRGGLVAELAFKYERVLGRLGIACEVLPDHAAPSPSEGRTASGSGVGGPVSAPGAVPASTEPGRTRSSPPAGGEEGGAGEAGVLAAPAGGPG